MAIPILYDNPDSPHDSTLKYGSIDNWGERSEPHTCGENGKLSIYIYVGMFGTCVFRIYTSCPICARCNISTLYVDHCCSRDKTSKTQ